VEPGDLVAVALVKLVLLIPLVEPMELMDLVAVAVAVAVMRLLDQPTAVIMAAAMVVLV
jgi:hypothetical protein